ncbi:AI-2E family transporter [Pararoseomonas indoligenes]|uniref:AI-2E family transporter n=1 Tax=Roseomonas indoligenes TaxID=2820811 RepID=A0A940MUT2_9PROT|nr:AI-2E family transporter [Pararoseomonas indoligenes]MBP0491154.1 AI-2E family transporter [Pararoseomonas indoligenes]
MARPGRLRHRGGMDHPAPLLPGRVQPLARLLVGLALFLLGAWIIRGFLPALGWAVILAVAAWPLYRRALAARPGAARLGLPLLATAAMALLFLLPLGAAALELGEEARQALHWAREAQEHGAPVPGWVAGLPLVGPQASSWWAQTLAAPQAGASFLHRMSEGELIGLGRSFGGALAHRAVLFGFTLLTLFFLFRDGEALAAQGLRVAERLLGPGVERVGRQAAASVRGTVSGLVLVGLGEGVLLGIAYAVAGVPHPLMFGALTAVAAMVPFAAPLVFGVAALLLVVAGKTGAAIAVFAFGMVVLFVADHAVRPALIGGATRLPFLWVLLGILGGVEGFGLLGLFVGPAVMAVLVLLWRDAAGD